MPDGVALVVDPWSYPAWEGVQVLVLQWVRSSSEPEEQLDPETPPGVGVLVVEGAASSLALEKR